MTEISNVGGVIGIYDSNTLVYYTEWVPLVAPAIVSSRSMALPLTEGASQTLNFTATAWNTEQTITVSAVADTDGVSETVMLTHSTMNASTVAEYDGATDVTAATLPALVVDTSPQTTGAQTAALAVTEETASAPYTVR